jgi:hypothetical protein
VDIHLIISKLPCVFSSQEFNPKLNALSQFFFEEPVVPERGYFQPPRGRSSA